MTAIFLFIFGLVIGSFLNVVAFRYSEEGSLFSLRKWSGRSHCLFCTQPLKWYELIPLLSFVIQEGRCLVCRKKLSWQYPLVELASGLTFLLPLYFNNAFNFAPATLYPLSVVWILVFLIFILIWAIDARLSVIPDELNIGLAVLGIAFIDLNNGFQSGLWLNHLLAAAGGAVFLGMIIYWSQGRAMGMGDLKLAVALGLIFGWPNLFLILALAFIFGAVVGIGLLAFKKKGMKDAIPFGPFLILGSLTIFFFGQTLVETYFYFFLA